MRILFISRAFPPVTGGIENHNYALSVWLKTITPTTTIANPYGKKFLPFFFPYAILKALFLHQDYDVLLLGDGVLAPLGNIVKYFFPNKVIVSVVHGLDLTYANTFYQKYWLQKFLPSLDTLLAVSRETEKCAIEKGIAQKKIIVIPNGIETETLVNFSRRSDLQTYMERDIHSVRILLTTGRLVKRKGVEWFIRHVLPSLPENTLYFVVGKGPEELAIRQAIEETHPKQRVILLGRVSDEVRNLLLNTVDIFIQPNIPVVNDMEGFGIAVIEAAACGRPVIAANLEGLKDAIIPDENGILVEAGNSEAFSQAIKTLLADDRARQELGERAKIYTKEHYHWKSIASRYVAALTTLMKK